MAESVHRHKRPAGGRLVPRVAAWVLPGMVLAGLLGYLHHYLDQPGRLPLRVIEIAGEFTHLDQDAIEERVAAAIHGGFFDVDLTAIRKQVTAMPWVGQVSVRRIWPDTLRMHVTEQVPLAHWNEDALVNLDGGVFRPARLPELGSLPRLRGEDEMAPRVVDFYLQLHARLVSEPLRVATLALNRRGEWRVGFREGLDLVLGREDVARRQHAFLDLYPRLLKHMDRQPERIDMRYEHGFAVRWRENTGDS